MCHGLSDTAQLWRLTLVRSEGQSRTDQRGVMLDAIVYIDIREIENPSAVRAVQDLRNMTWHK